MIDLFFENGFAIATQSAGSNIDPLWPGCLACALIDRQLKQANITQPKFCKNCFDTYCSAE